MTSSASPNYEIDAEAVLAAAPDVFIGGGGFEDPAYPALRDAGIAVVDNADWHETSPKGWAEWVGFFAALTNTEAEASALYEEWVTDYDDAAVLAATTATERPTVIDGSMFEGTWYMAAGDSIRFTFIADAGGDYLFGDNEETATVAADIERRCRRRSRRRGAGRCRRLLHHQVGGGRHRRALRQPPPGTVSGVLDRRRPDARAALRRVRPDDDRALPARLRQGDPPRFRRGPRVRLLTQIPNE